MWRSKRVIHGKEQRFKPSPTISKPRQQIYHRIRNKKTIRIILIILTTQEEQKRSGNDGLAIVCGIPPLHIAIIKEKGI